MARKQFIETPRQIVERVLRDTQVLIDMSEIEQDERLQRGLSEYIPVAGGSVQRSAQERREHQRGEFSFMR